MGTNVMGATHFKPRQATSRCPWSKLEEKVMVSKCPFHKYHAQLPLHGEVKHSQDVTVVRGTFMRTDASANLLVDIGGSSLIHQGCTRFYARSVEDFTLAPFMTVEEDGAAAHGTRLADWIVEKMGGEGKPWTESGRYGLRQHSHFQAWNSNARDSSVRGDHFQLDDCIVWMRIHFWAMREVGLAEHLFFWEWYVGFIQHFIAVYERRAPAFTQAAAAWSREIANTQTYIENGNRMLDVIGKR